MSEVTKMSAGWPEAITSSWNKAFDGIIETGRLLVQAKDELPHGTFTAMVESELPFGATTARRLMSVANDARIANRAHAHVLPPSWYTLYELTKLDDEQFEAATSPLSPR